MFKPQRSTNILMKIITNSFIDLPTPSNISSWWNMGSLLGICMGMQMITGILISMHYTADPQFTFKTIIHIMSDVNMGWLLRTIHANTASLLFICMYMHVGRNLYYSSCKLVTPWLIGLSILLLTMMAAFLGYVLPWGQMSYWGATVITNLLSVIPYVGKNLTLWLWGGFSINKPTLTRFFTLHFTLPFLISAIIILHILSLHKTGSSNPLGISSNQDKLTFHPFFSSKDTLGFSLLLMAFIYMNLSYPFILNDPDNFKPANPLTTPVHIQPEWYFLFAYAILRSVPNKMGGVIALLGSIMILLTPLMMNKTKFGSKTFYPTNQFLFWLFVINLILLTWIGSQPVEESMHMMSQATTSFHFLYFILTPLVSSKWDHTLK